MKSLILYSLIFRGFFSFTFAQSITLISSTNTVDINTMFWLTVQVDGLTNPGEVQIQWVEKFVVRGQAQSTSMQLINGQQSLQIQLQLQLQPSASGSFVLWPARITLGTGTIESNTLTIDVTGEKLFLQPQQVNTLLGVQEEQVSPEENEYPISSIPVVESWSSRWRWIGGICVLIGGWIFWVIHTGPLQKKTALVKNEDLSAKQKIVLPSEEDEVFWERMDLWWRENLSKTIHKDCSSATYQELLPHIQLLSTHQQELFAEAFTCIQQARYAQHEGNRAALLQLAHRFISSEHK
jgi:hypothetical protein